VHSPRGKNSLDGPPTTQGFDDGVTPVQQLHINQLSARCARLTRRRVCPRH
jgi:hypothetical protein